MKIIYSETSGDQIEDLLMGRRVTKVGPDELVLDNGTRLKLKGNEGGCSCGSGDYDLTELNGCDNVITKAEVVMDPSGDDWPGGKGVYQIFVYADNQKINLATFEGSDGNGYYGTGFMITATVEETNE